MDGTFPTAKKGGVIMTKESGGFDQIDQWKSTMFLYSSALKSINTKIEILNNEFIQLYNYNPIEHITSRLKTPESIVKKLKNDGCEVTIDNMVEHLNDIAGIRIICSFMSDIYPIADMIARQADITVLHVKDYIKYPKANGYKSYHHVVALVSEGERIQELPHGGDDPGLSVRGKTGHKGGDPDQNDCHGFLGFSGTQDRLQI